MKKTKTLYWIFTGLFGAFMLFSAIPDILVVPDAVTFIAHLGYPKYFIPFIGVAKALGVIAILVPGFPRIKEWAYAGLFFDLIGATYSNIATDGFMVQMMFMVLPFGLGIASYVFYHKRLKESLNVAR
jgi:DoxX-like family